MLTIELKYSKYTYISKYYLFIYSQAILYCTNQISFWLFQTIVEWIHFDVTKTGVLTYCYDISLYNEQ